MAHIGDPEKYDIRSEPGAKPVGPFKDEPSRVSKPVTPDPVPQREAEPAGV